MLYGKIGALVEYGVKTGLIEPDDAIYTRNRLLEAFGEDDWKEEPPAQYESLGALLDTLCDEAVLRGVIGDGVTARDLFDTKLMGLLTMRPSAVNAKFKALYAQSPEKATDWFYRFCGDCNYIRRERVARDLKWVYRDPRFGDIDITINLSKPEKDPKAIAAAKKMKASGYPACMLCKENIGYAGPMDFPARQNHRAVPVTINGADWFFQYSPYVYYNEHCIVFCGEHVPMQIDERPFRKLFDFVEQFPHYFLGSNADLPIVGGSILSHDHFQGGRFTFPMELAPDDFTFEVKGYPDITCSAIKWPLSVIRIRGCDRARLAQLAEHILAVWRGYSDESVEILAESDGEPHNTITPIARRRGVEYELDLALRNNRTSAEHPFGIFHPHTEYHHIKKENIGLIEVMGLAVLPPRLKNEIGIIRDCLLGDREAFYSDEAMDKHCDWYRSLCERDDINEDTVDGILRDEVGRIFTCVLENAGVFKRDAEGRAAFQRFAASL